MKLFGRTIEWKVVSMTAVSLLVGGVIAVLNEVQADNSLLGGLPGWLQSVLIVLLPSALKFFVGYKTRHTPAPPARFLPPLPGEGGAPAGD